MRLKAPKHLLKAFITLSVLICSASLKASESTEEACSQLYKNIGMMNFYRVYNPNNDRCFLSVKKIEESMVYRSFLLDESGMFMVFNSYSDVDDVMETGARVFMFFPRTQIPTASDNGNRLHIKTTNPQLDLIFDIENGRLIGTNQGPASEDPKIHPENKGGVELGKIGSLYLDTGFKRGGDSRLNKTKKSKFVDMNGNSCYVTNKALFEYDADDDVFFRFSDAELKTFLKKECPQLTVNY